MKNVINSSFICLLMAFGVQGQGLMNMFGNLFSTPNSGLGGNKDSAGAGQANAPFSGRAVGGGRPAPQQNYVWGYWGEFGSCSRTCGTGVSVRQRMCYYYGQRAPARPTSNGGGFGANSMLPFLFSGSSGSSGLSSMLTLSLLSGGGGLFGNNQRPVTPNRNGNSQYAGQHGCPGSNLNRTSCQMAPCKTSCLTQWGDFGQCSASCGASTKMRARLCTCASCPEPLRETLPCLNLPPCVPIRPYATIFPSTKTPTTMATMKPTTQAISNWAAWSRWTVCSVTCGGGLRRRTRYCLGENQYGCGVGSEETQNCNLNPCEPGLQSSADWTEWGAFSPCTSTCGDATKIRVRFCPAGSNACAGSGVEMVDCGNPSCRTSPPIQSRYSNWSPWAACRRLEGGIVCVQERIRQCLGDDGSCEGFPKDSRPCRTGLCAPVTLPPQATTPIATTTTTRAPNQDRCDARRPETRVDCGYKGITRTECLSRGCCYNDRLDDVVWCFIDNGVEGGVTQYPGIMAEIKDDGSKFSFP